MTVFVFARLLILCFSAGEIFLVLVSVSVPIEISSVEVPPIVTVFSSVGPPVSE